MLGNWQISIHQLFPIYSECQKRWGVKNNIRVMREWPMRVFSHTDKHVSDIGLRKPGWYHPRVHAGEEHRLRLRQRTLNFKKIQRSDSKHTLGRWWNSRAQCEWHYLGMIPHLLKLLYHAVPVALSVLHHSLQYSIHNIVILIDNQQLHVYSTLEGMTRDAWDSILRLLPMAMRGKSSRQRAARRVAYEVIPAWWEKW